MNPLKNQLLALTELAPKVVSVEIPELGPDPAFVRVMTGRERDDYERAQFELTGGDAAAGLVNFRARLLARCLCDNRGELLFTPADADALGNLPAPIAAKLFEAAAAANGLNAAAAKGAEKN